MDDNIGVIVVNYGRPDLGLRTLNSFLKTTKNFPNIRLVVIDTGVPEHEHKERELKTIVDIPNIHCVVAFDRNMGKGYGYNLGVSLLREQCEYHKLEEPDYYIFLDNDVIFREGWLEKGLKLYKKYQDSCSLFSFYRGGSPKHRFTGLLDDPDAEGNDFGRINSSEGMCWLMTKEAVKSMGKLMTYRPISGIDWDTIHKLEDANKIEFLALDGYIKHIGFGYSTHRGEIMSWDTQLNHDTMLEEKYGTIRD